MPFRPHVLRFDEEGWPEDEANLPTGAAEADSEEAWLDDDLLELASELTAQARRLDACYPAGCTTPAQTVMRAPAKRSRTPVIAAALTPVLLSICCLAAYYLWAPANRDAPTTPTVAQRSVPSPLATELPVAPQPEIAESSPEPALEPESTAITPVFLREASGPELEAMYDIWEEDGQTSLEI